ncbi:MAG TPA: 50S ribosome-binding protein YggL [Gemmatimonadaceae bacterium]
MSGLRARRGFPLRCRLAVGLGAAQTNVLLRSLTQAIDDRGLAMFGSLGQEISLIVVRHDSDASDDDRRALARWAMTRPELRDYWVGPLLDSPLDQNADGLLQHPGAARGQR